jgi:MFS transporter, NNP family, nitrate/nitrite transporter
VSGSPRSIRPHGPWSSPTDPQWTTTSPTATDLRPYVTATTERQTWVIAALYIGTFGSFIGFSFALPLVIRTTFPEFLASHEFIRDDLGGLGFLGALVGSLSRPLGGWLSDRFGGARITFWVFVGMGLATGVAALGVLSGSFAGFLGAFLVVFLLSGVGNGATYRMIPMIFGVLGRRAAASNGGDLGATLLDFKRRAAAVIGLVGAIGALGGFVVQQVFRVASQNGADADWSVPEVLLRRSN